MADARAFLVASAALLLASCEPGAATHAAEGGAEAAASESYAPAVVAQGERFACTPVKVWDGDGPIHCAEGPKVRLSGIAAREMDGSCSPGHPCPDASAEAARDALAALLGRTTGSNETGHLLVEGPALDCVSEGSGKGSRTAAWCASPTAGDLSCAMVATGTAEKWDQYWRDHSCG